jgi:hypothetical protein
MRKRFVFGARAGRIATIACPENRTCQTFARKRRVVDERNVDNADLVQNDAAENPLRAFAGKPDSKVILS